MFPNLPLKNQQELEYLGYTKIGFLEAAVLAEFKLQSELLIKKAKKTFPKKELFNLINGDKYVKSTSNSMVREYLLPRVKELIASSEVEAFAVSHLIKPFGFKSDIWHQDSSIVDENKHYSLNAWTSLVDSTRLNGCLWVFPGSHINSNHFRQFGFNPVEGDFLNYLKPFLKPLTSKAGEIVLFHRNIIHGSGNNYLPFPRLAAECVIVPKNVQFFNYHRDENLIKDKILAYKVDYNHFMKPDPKVDFYSGLVDRIIYDDVTKEEMISNIKREIPKYITQAKKYSPN